MDPPVPTPSYRLLAVTIGLSFPIESAALAPNDFFAVKVVNPRTGQRIPMVKLQTNNDISYYTDSAGLAAIDEPGIMGKRVRLSLESHVFTSSGPGWEDEVKLTLTPGKSRTIEMTPHNVADRLYRQNGSACTGTATCWAHRLPSATHLGTTAK